MDDTFTSIDDGKGGSKVQNSLKVGTKYTTETQFRYCRSITSTFRSIGSLPFPGGRLDEETLWQEVLLRGQQRRRRRLGERHGGNEA